MDVMNVKLTSDWQLLYAFSFMKLLPNITELGGCPGPSSNVNSQSMANPSGRRLKYYRQTESDIQLSDKIYPQEWSQ